MRPMFIVVLCEYIAFNISLDKGFFFQLIYPLGEGILTFKNFHDVKVSVY
jgi:hypothetical protein